MEGPKIKMQEKELLGLFDCYSNMTYRIALSYLRHPQDAEDAVQAVFLKLIEGKAVPEPGKERAFITRITINYCKDVFRSAWKQRTEQLNDDIAFKHEEDYKLFHTLMGLPAKFRIVIYLHYYEGYTFPEIAGFLKISPSAVSMRIHRAKKLMKNTLGKGDDNEIGI